MKTKLFSFKLQTVLNALSVAKTLLKDGAAVLSDAIKFMMMLPTFKANIVGLGVISQSIKPGFVAIATFTKKVCLIGVLYLNKQRSNSVMKRKIFQHSTTRQVIEVEEVSRKVFQVLSSRCTLDEMTTSGWQVCKADPGYRGMPARNN